MISDEDLEKVQRLICGEPAKIDFAMFGCPHLSTSQVAEIARILEGQKPKVDFWVLTSSLTRELAHRMGYLQTIQRAGGNVVADTCIDVPPCWQPYYGKTGVTDSPKCAYYNEIRRIKFLIRPLAECVEAAVKGEVSR